MLHVAQFLVENCSEVVEASLVIVFVCARRMVHQIFQFQLWHVTGKPLHEGRGQRACNNDKKNRCMYSILHHKPSVCGAGFFLEKNLHIIGHKLFKFLQIFSTESRPDNFHGTEDINHSEARF